MDTSSHFEREKCAVLYESLLFMTVRIVLPSTDTKAIMALFFFPVQLKVTYNNKKTILGKMNSSNKKHERRERKKRKANSLFSEGRENSLILRE